MKRIYVLVIILITGFSVEAQQNQLPNIEITTDNAPHWLNDLPPADKIWGIGVGKLSTENASCELAKFHAQADICRSISQTIKQVKNELDNPSASEQRLLEKLNLYQNEFYMLLVWMASEEVAFELGEFIKVERRTKTKDGHIWYLASIQKNVANNFEKLILNYVDASVESYLEPLKDDSEKKLDEAFKMLKELD
jgi:hypothetical protein